MDTEQAQRDQWEQRTELPLRAEDAAQALRSFQHEADSAAVYRAMAKIECNAHLAEVYSRLAQAEERQGSCSVAMGEWVSVGSLFHVVLS